jgi:Transposase DDE domain group 1
MADPTGEANRGALRLDFERRLLLQFRGSAITSDAGLLPYRELDDAVGLTDTAANTLADARTGKNIRHLLGGLLRQSVFGRLAGYEDVNDADRLCRDPAMRWVVGDRAITGSAASASQMGRFETKWLTRPENLAALADLPGRWIDKVHQRRPPRLSATLPPRLPRRPRDIRGTVKGSASRYSLGRTPVFQWSSSTRPCTTTRHVYTLANCTLFIQHIE